MKKIISLTLLLAGIVLADNAASDVTSAQRWPWNGKVDINYTLTATTTKTTPVFSVRFFYEDPEGNTFELTTLSGDAATGITLGAGPKKTTWDATEALGTNVDADGYKFAVYAEDVTEQATYLVLDLTTYKMTTSTTGPSVAEGASSKYAELWFRRIENGTFVMGSSTNETRRTAEREAEHTVTLSKAYYIGVFVLTQGQYDRINADGTSTAVLPQSRISYDMLRGTSYGKTWPVKNDHRVDATSFFGKLRTKTGNGLIFDLPTEAQWEAAARWKGTTGNGTNDYYGSCYWNNGVQFTDTSYYGIDNVAWHYFNSGKATHEVGLKAASTIGTYDMHGNVWEWCLDWFVEDITSYVSDPEGPDSSGYDCRLIRGGGYYRSANDCRMAFRNCSTPSLAHAHLGCRVALLP